MEIKDMKLSDVQARIKELKEFNLEDGTLEEINENTKELRELQDKEEAILKVAEERKSEMNRIAKIEEPKIIENFKEERGQKQMEQTFNAESTEYRSAYFKKLAEETLTEVEERAFTHTTLNTEAVLPKQTVDTIWNMIEEQHAILGDITLYRTGTIIEVAKHTAIVAGDAKVVAEGVANDDEQNTFVKVTLSGKDFSKHVEISYALGKMTAGALENYLTNEIAERLGAVLAEDVIAQINTDMDSGNKALATATDTIAWAEVAGAFGALKNAGAPTVYVNNSTLYNNLVSLTDTTGRPLFQNSMQQGVQGVLMGANVKVEDALADGEVLVGDPKKVIGNMIQDIMVEADKDIKRHVHIYSGYARFECALVAPKAFAKLTVTVGG